MSKREYIISNRKWLEDKAKEKGVKALPKGIYYKVLKAGTRKVHSCRSGASSPSYTGNKFKFTWRSSDNSLSLINLSRNRIFTEHYTPQFE